MLVYFDHSAAIIIINHKSCLAVTTSEYYTQDSYNANPEPKEKASHAASRASYNANPEQKNQASQDSYNANPDSKKKAVAREPVPVPKYNA